MHAMTAAHTTLPLPTWVEVTNLANGKRVVVKVNDRGPFVDNRLIDLSYAAATELDMVRMGTTRVEVRTVAPPRDAVRARRDVVAAAPALAPARRRPRLAVERMFVQVGAFARARECRAARRASARERLREPDRRQRAERPAQAAPRAAGADSRLGRVRRS